MSHATDFTTLPLLVAPAAPLGWHQVTAPGGYESWSFDAEDDTGEFRWTAELFEGCPYHRGYRSAYLAFRRWPTRVRPPLPADWPCVHFSLFRRDKRVAGFVSGHRSGEFKAAAQRDEVVVGSSRLTLLQDGSLRLVLRGPADSGGQIVATFDLRPRLQIADPPTTNLFPRPPRPLATPTRYGGDHWWMVPNPLCDVNGNIQLYDPQVPGAAEMIAFRGRGFHDRSYGTAPPGRGLKRWLRGRLLLDDTTLAFQLGVESRSRRTVAHLLEARAADPGATTPPSLQIAAAEARWDGRTPLQMRYPTLLSIDGDRLRLSDPTILATESHALRLVYKATSAGREGTAFCQLIYPRRVRWMALRGLFSRQ